MKNLTLLLKPVSSACNMRCNYCFYGDVSTHRKDRFYGTMDEETVAQILSNVFRDLEAGDQICFAFQGGEPTLAGLPFYRSFTARARCLAGARIHLFFSIQTNGLLLDDAWCRFLKEEHYLVGLSLDGPPSFHNRQRPDAQGIGTFSPVLLAKERLQQWGVEYNLLTVLTNSLARHPRELWRFLLEQEERYVQLIPCLGPLEGSSTLALTPERYANFYRALFDLWSASLRQGRYISIRLFDDYAALLARNECHSCGLTGRCSPQIVVEADGSVYPCDYYALDTFCAGNLKDMSLSALFQSPRMRDFPHRSIERSHLCSDCPHIQLCGGGCPRLRQEVYSAAKNGLCGHRILLDHILPRLESIIWKIPSSRS